MTDTTVAVLAPVSSPVANGNHSIQASIHPSFDTPRPGRHLYRCQCLGGNNLQCTKIDISTKQKIFSALALTHDKSVSNCDSFSREWRFFFAAISNIILNVSVQTSDHSQFQRTKLYMEAIWENINVNYGLGSPLAPKKDRHNLRCRHRCSTSRTDRSLDSSIAAQIR